ncbi:hypothetical protein [Microbulbifer magnicolonia]|uniref:hypothetical protein n=1 Tax=Microbulbifer magnicolonia TaxID=3109744 RepID=UPI002B414784|nr:hypothetical protein [Microbulbifer sp. GG15]
MDRVDGDGDGDVGVLCGERDSLTEAHPARDVDDRVELEWIGRGRSANVYVGKNQEGGRVAHKIFTPDSLSKLVFYVIDGAPNPYGWNEHAIQSAVTRRHILALLIEYWFSDRLTLPETYGSGWNERVRAYQMYCEFINGYHLPLRGPGNDEEADHLPTLTNDIMKPLQHNLEEAGFDGLVWQAGRGNPVAASNFMLRQHSGADPKWVWIDLESGVPALFAINPLEQLKFYLPACFRYGRALFDDTNMSKLRSYMDMHREGIEGAHGKGSVERILTYVDNLEYHQVRWKSMPRCSRSIESHRVRGVISDSEALWYKERPLKWYSRLLTRGAAKLTGKLASSAKKGCLGIVRFNYSNLFAGLCGFLTSQKYRTHLSRSYVAKRIEEWEQRKILKPAAFSKLYAELISDESSEYITDFGVHLMIKPAVKLLQWSVFPMLFMAGAINELVLAMVLVGGGSIGRTTYTLGRMTQAAFRRQRLPWTALGVGVLPVVGNAAYPVEFVKCGAGDERILARFIIYDTFARVGRAIPIWGGPDTLTEHYFNRLPDNLFTWYKRTLQRRPSFSSNQL